MPAQPGDRRAGTHPGGGAGGHPRAPGQAAKIAASTEPPLHIHHRADEPWYILDGKMTFHIADEVLEATATRTHPPG
jgi:mannose-6-phosphate isomerase-like protein (cupin superfamily)